jgi:hypothetical protein
MEHSFAKSLPFLGAFFARLFFLLFLVRYFIFHSIENFMVIPFSTAKLIIGCRWDKPAFGIRPFARFGNHLVQLIFCLINAHRSLVRTVIVEDNFLFITGPVSTTDHFDIWPKSACMPATVYWKQWWVRPSRMVPSPKAICDCLRVPLSRFYPKLHIPNDTLVMHFRSDDVFGTTKWQPPCSFYLGAMIRFARSIAIAADDVNPCVKIAVEHGATWVNQSLLQDFATMLWAPNFVLSVSTLANAALLLSPIAKNLFFFKEQPPIGWKQGHVAAVHACRPSVTYERMAVGVIRRIPKHIRLLVEENCTWVS